MAFFLLRRDPLDPRHPGEWSGEDSPSLEARELQEEECSGDWSSQGPKGGARCGRHSQNRAADS